MLVYISPLLVELACFFNYPQLSATSLYFPIYHFSSCSYEYFLKVSVSFLFLIVICAGSCFVISYKCFFTILQASILLGFSSDIYYKYSCFFQLSKIPLRNKSLYVFHFYILYFYKFLCFSRSKNNCFGCVNVVAISFEIFTIFVSFFCILIFIFNLQTTKPKIIIIYHVYYLLLIVFFFNCVYLF